MEGYHAMLQPSIAFNLSFFTFVSNPSENFCPRTLFQFEYLLGLMLERRSESGVWN